MVTSSGEVADCIKLHAVTALLYLLNLTIVIQENVIENTPKCYIHNEKINKQVKTAWKLAEEFKP